MDGSGRIAIGRLSKDTGTNVETIRYYERTGLLPPPARSASGYRLYRADHLKRLNFIRRGRALGFSIGKIRTLLRLADERIIVLPLTSGFSGAALLTFASFASAMALMMLLTSLLVGLAKASLLRRLQASTVWIKRVSGLVLIAAGLYLGYYYIAAGM